MKSKILNLGKAFLVPAALYLLFLVINPARFGTWKTFSTICMQSVIPTILGYSVAFSFICGITDFSLGSRMTLAGLVGGILCLSYGLTGLIVGAFVTSIILGVIMGFAGKIRVPQLVVTIGMGMIFEIVGYWVSHIWAADYVDIGTEYSFLTSPPYMFGILAVCAVAFYILMERTKFSYHSKAVGNDPAIAKNMGISVSNTKFAGFVVGALFVAVVSIMQISLSSVMAPATNLASASALFNPLMGVMVGMALAPLCNLVVGIFIGELSLNIIYIGLVAAGFPSTVQNVALGFFMIVVLLISGNKALIHETLLKMKLGGRGEIQSQSNA